MICKARRSAALRLHSGASRLRCLFLTRKTPVGFDRYCNIHHKNDTKKVINSHFGWLYLLPPPAFFLHHFSTRFEPGRKKKTTGGSNVPSIDPNVSSLKNINSSGWPLNSNNKLETRIGISTAFGINRTT